MPKCDACGQEVAADDAFCRRCGRALGGHPDERDAFMQEMAAAFERRLKDEAADTDAAYNLALAHFYARRYQAALPLLQRVTKELPELAEARGKLAVALWLTGSYAEGLEEMEEAVRRAPADQRLCRLRDQMRAELERSQG
jgi:tetratricopeptide (TPR) repeat protein